MEILDKIFVDFDKPRDRNELESYYLGIADLVKSNEKIAKLNRLKTGLFKELREEYFALLLFSKTRFFPKNGVGKVVIGNQNYDALVWDENGNESRYEFTEYIDGRKQFYDAIELNEYGHTKVKDIDLRSLESKAGFHLEKTIKNSLKKANKNYCNINLIIIVDVFEIFTVYNNSAEEYINLIRKVLSKIKFRAESVYLIIKGVTHYKDIDKYTYKIK